MPDLYSHEPTTRINITADWVAAVHWMTPRPLAILCIYLGCVCVYIFQENELVFIKEQHSTFSFIFDCVFFLENNKKKSTGGPLKN